MLQMRIQVSEHNTPVLYVSYGGEELRYNVSRTTRRNQNFNGIYDVANNYFKTLTDDDARRFFGILKREQANRKGEFSTPEYMVELKNEMRKAIGYMNFNRFLEWFKANSEGMHVPQTVKEAPVEYNRDRGQSQTKTYDEDSYVEFIGLATFMGIMFPLYTDYLNYLLLPNAHPHYRVFKLFLDSDIDKEVGPLNKLREYITEIHRVFHGNSGQQNLVISAGLSTEDVTDYFVADSLLNKLSLENYFDPERQINPISHIHQLVKFNGQLRNANTDNIVLKSPRSSAGGGEDEFAVFEESRKTTDVAPGLVDEQRTALNDDAAILIGLGYNPEQFDWEFYNNELKYLPEFLEYPIEDTTRYLLGWFLKETVSPRALDQIDNKRIIELVLMAKTCMFMENTPALTYFGTFLSSVYDGNAPYVNPDVVVKGSLSKELLEELMSLFKYHINDRGFVPEKVILETSRRIANLPWRPLGTIPQPEIVRDGFLRTPDNINDIVISYVKYVLSLGPLNQA